MRKQKEQIIPQVTTSSAIVDVTDWNAATDFTTQPIQFPESTEWALEFTGWSGVTEGLPTATILHGNSLDGDFVPYSTSATDIDLTVDQDRMVYSRDFQARYMKISYTSGGSTGDFSLILSK